MGMRLPVSGSGLELYAPAPVSQRNHTGIPSGDESMYNSMRYRRVRLAVTCHRGQIISTQRLTARPASDKIEAFPCIITFDGLPH